MAESSAKHCQRELFRVLVFARLTVSSSDAFWAIRQEALTPNTSDENYMCKSDEFLRHLFFVRYTLSAQRSSVA